MTIIQQSGTVDPSVGNAAGPNHHAVAGSAAEITTSSHGAVVFPFWALELQTQPKAWRKVRRTEVTQERHLVGAGEQDLHAHVETDLTVRHGRGPGCVAEGAPALALKAGMTPFIWKKKKKNIVRIRVSPKVHNQTPAKNETETHLVAGRLLLVRFWEAMADDVLELRRIVPAREWQASSLPRQRQSELIGTGTENLTAERLRAETGRRKVRQAIHRPVDSARRESGGGLQLGGRVSDRFYTRNLSTRIQRALKPLSHVANLIIHPVSCLWRILRVQGGFWIFPIFDNKKTEALLQPLKSLHYHNFQVQTAQRAGAQNVKNRRREKQK